MEQNTLAIKYVLYSHYSVSEQDDFEKYSNNEVDSIEKLNGVQHLENHLKGLKELLTAPGHEGQLVLFYSSGFEEFIHGISESNDVKTMVKNYPRLAFSSKIAEL